MKANLSKIAYRFPSPKFKMLDRTHFPGYKLRGLRGGRGSAKSWSTAMYIVKCMREYNTFVVAGREIQKALKESAFKLLSDTIRRLGLDSEFFVLRDEIRHRITGSRCVFTGLRANPQAIKSLESAHILWLEEATQISMESWRLIIPTMRAKGWVIIATWNPSLPTDPVEIIFEENRWRAIVENFTYLDNPMLDHSKVEEAEMMMKQDYELYCHEYLGYYAPQGSNAVVPLKDILAAQTRISDWLDMPKIAALDVAHMGKDDNAFVVREGNIITTIETCGQMRDKDTAAWASNLCIEHGIQHLVVDVAGGIGIFQEIEDMGLVKYPHQFNGAWGAPTEFANKRAECWFLMREWIKTVGTLPKHRRLADELMAQTYKMTNLNKKLLTSKKDMDDSPDVADACSMCFLPGIFDAVTTTDLSKYHKPQIYSKHY